MKLQMYPILLEVRDNEEIVITQPGGTGQVVLTVEQIPFLNDLLNQARNKVEDDRYHRRSN